jgi:hypothetical protein
MELRAFVGRMSVLTAVAIHEIMIHFASSLRSNCGVFVFRCGLTLTIFFSFYLPSALAQSQRPEEAEQPLGRTWQSPDRGFPTIPRRVRFPSPSLPQPVRIFLPPEPIDPPEGPITNPEVRARYYVDVTDYGAVSSATIDNTAAIQAAINAACAPVTQARPRPILFFPPGGYVVSQPQVPSTDSPLNIPCTIEIEGSGTEGGAQFSTLAHGSRLGVTMGAHPNAAAVLTYRRTSTPYGLAIIRNLTIDGANQAVAIYGAVPSILEDVCLSVQATGLPDNTPLKVTDTFWFWYKGGCLQTTSPDIPVGIFTAEKLPDLPNAEQLDGLIYLSDLITAGDGFKYIQRANENVGLAGNFVFRNITLEDAGDVLEISQTCTGCANLIYLNVTFDNVTTSDSSCFTCSILNMNSPDGTLSGIVMVNSLAGNGGQGRAITINAGRIGSRSINNCCTTAVVDSKGDPVWDYTGKVTLSGGTKTMDFYPVVITPNAGPPICVTNDETTLNGSHVTTTLTSMTISGGQSDVVDYACFMNYKNPPH